MAYNPALNRTLQGHSFRISPALRDPAAGWLCARCS